MLTQAVFERLQSGIEILKQCQVHHVPRLSQQSQITKNLNKLTMALWMDFKSTTEMGEHWPLWIHKFHLEILQGFTLSLEGAKDVTSHVHQSHWNAAVLQEKLCSEDFCHELGGSWIEMKDFYAFLPSEPKIFDIDAHTCQTSTFERSYMQHSSAKASQE